MVLPCTALDDCDGLTSIAFAAIMFARCCCPAVAVLVCWYFPYIGICQLVVCLHHCCHDRPDLMPSASCCTLFTCTAFEPVFGLV